MRGFLFTMDASISMLLLISFSVLLIENIPRLNLDEEALMQLTQDAIEVCSLEMNANNQCVIGLLKKVSPGIKFNDECREGVHFRRRYYLAEGIDLTVC